VALPEANNITLQGDDSVLGGTNSIKLISLHECLSASLPNQ